MTRIKTALTRLALVTLLFSVFSCNTENLDVEPLSNEEVAEILEATISRANGGLAGELIAITEALSDLTLEDLCDTLYTDTISYSYGPTSGRQADLDATWSFEMVCGGLLTLPETATITYTSAVSYETPRLSSDDAASFSGVLSGLQLTSPVLFWSGSYLRSGTQELRFRNQNDVSSDLDLTLTNVEITKTGDPSIAAGSGVFSFDVTLNGTTTNYAGSITFNGDGTATVVVNGVPYVINPT